MVVMLHRTSACNAVITIVITNQPMRISPIASWHTICTYTVHAEQYASAACSTTSSWSMHAHVIASASPVYMPVGCSCGQSMANQTAILLLQHTCKLLQIGTCCRLQNSSPADNICVGCYLARRYCCELHKLCTGCYRWISSQEMSVGVQPESKSV